MMRGDTYRALRIVAERMALDVSFWRHADVEEINRLQLIGGKIRTIEKTNRWYYNVDT